jgi:predicted transcriptional regulator
MKLDILLEQNLEESAIKKAAAALAITAAASSIYLNQDVSKTQTPTQQITQVVKKAQMTERDIVDKITKQFGHVDDITAMKFLNLAKKYEDNVFPKKEDILAIIAVESHFKKGLKSKLKTDPALGVMQIRARRLE